MKNALILLAGGEGKRFAITKKTKPKQFIKIGNNNFIEYFLENLDEEIFDIIQIVVKKSLQKKYLSNLKKPTKIKYIFKNKIYLINSHFKKKSF